MANSLLEGMPMPTIHSCNQIHLENARLQNKINCLLVEISNLRTKIEHLQETPSSQFFKRTIETQTNTSSGGRTPLNLVKTSTRSKQQYSATDRLLDQLNIMQSKFERELKQNNNHVQTITTLNAKIQDLLQGLQRSEAHVKSLDEKLRHMNIIKSSTPKSDVTESNKLHKLKVENSKLLQDYRKAKQQLSAFDKNFFDEIEDMKYALHQSTKLNQEYEKVLKHLCDKHGLAYPPPKVEEYRL